ncbi:MAG: Ig-like domain-containing protein [Myxococcales bacterium]|nr:Ig-like domain-containing protein [Myxococcales bacterium]
MRNASIFALLSLGLLGAGALTGCSDQPYDPEAPALDPDAPNIHITTPARGTFAGDVRTVMVHGTVTDNDAVASVEVNGVAATLDGKGEWSVTVPVTTGTQLLHAVAKDAQGNVGKESRAVVTGPMKPIATAVPQAITATMSAQTFDAVGRGVTGFLRTGDLAGLIAPQNPIVNVNPDSDNNFARADVIGMSVGAATTVALVPRPGGLALDVELHDVEVKVRLAYAVLGIDGGRDVTVAASRIKVTGNLNLGVAQGAFDIQLVDQHVTVTGFDVDFGGVPGKIIDLLRLDRVLGPVVGLAIEKLVVPMVNRALGGLNHTQTLDVLGTPVDIQVRPAHIACDADGAVIELDTTLRAQGDSASPGYVYLANTAPAMATDRGFQLAIADDAANQLLGSYWAAKGMDLTFDLTTGSYGQIGELYDRVELSAKVPPYVDAHGGALKLTIGDLVATFKHGSEVATQVAVSAEVELKVVTASDGTPRLDVGSPTTYLDVLDENINSANPLSNAQFEVITSFALARVIAFGSGAIGAVPLPSFGGVGLHDVAIAEHGGYLVVEGEVQ